MKYSNSYVFFPDNKALEKALQHFVGKLIDPDPQHIWPDTRVTELDNFIHTRGNFEQHRYRGSLLDPAREVFEQELAEDHRRQAPVEWARTQNDLGNVLAAQAQQFRDEAMYRKAMAAFGLALEVLSKEKTPIDWATTQSNLGTAAQAVGRQQNDPKLLKQAVDAYTSALLVWNREQTPEEWARTMHQLGDTFHAHGLLLKGNTTLQKSVVAYKNALRVFNADDHTLELAATHMNCGAVLHHLAESEQNADRLAEAIKSYETGLLVCMEQQLPIHLAVLGRVNIATAKGKLAELKKDARMADETADEFEVILEAFRGSFQPLCLKHCESQRDQMRSLAETLGTKA
jgi:tetratricopeptide (TPR) repeat protein